MLHLYIVEFDNCHEVRVVTTDAKRALEIATTHYLKHCQAQSKLKGDAFSVRRSAYDVMVDPEAPK